MFVYDVLKYAFDKFDVRIPFHHIKSGSGLWELAHEVFSAEAETFLGNAFICAAVRVWQQQAFRQMVLLFTDTCAHLNPFCARLFERGHPCGHQLSTGSRTRWWPRHQRGYHILLNSSGPCLLPHQPKHWMGVCQSPYFTGALFYLHTPIYIYLPTCDLIPYLDAIPSETRSQSDVELLRYLTDFLNSQGFEATSHLQI